MRVQYACGLSGLVMLAGAANLAAQADEYTTELKYKPARVWKAILPKETWTEVKGIPIPHSTGSGFQTEKNGLKLSVDSDADGRLDTTVKGSNGFVVLNGKHADGSKLQYAARVKLVGKVYKFAAGGAMTGSIYSVPIQLIDQNNNGTYNEYGVDAMVVGKTNAAHFLSKVVNLKGELYDFHVTADGRTVTVKQFAGESGTLNLRRGLKLPGQLLSAVVSEEGSPISFNIAGTSEFKVPVGSYKFTGGFAKKGGDSAMLDAGAMKSLVVRSDDATSLDWGAPLTAVFNYTRNGNEITVQPEVTFHGRAGERWHTLLPDSKSPKLAFFDEDTGKKLGAKRFEGC